MKYIIIFIASGVVAACAAQPVSVTPYSSGGSKADGSVEMTYNTSFAENAQPDWIAAGREAKKRCEAWGYSKAEPFEGIRSVCKARNGYGWCLDEEVTRTFQCLE